MPGSHEAKVDTAVLVIISMVMAAVLSLSIYLRWRLGGITAPTIQTCAATLWCGLNGASRQIAIRPTLLLCFRTAVVAWMLYRLTTFFEEPTLSGLPVTLDWKLSFFTVWNYLLQFCYWVLSMSTSAIHLVGTRCRLPAGASFGGDISRFLRASSGLASLQHALFSTCLPSALLVSIVLWTILYPADAAKGHAERELNFASYNQHAINTALLLLEFCVNRFVVPIQHLYLTLGWASSYVVFAWVQHFSTHRWPYFFLDLSGPPAIAWYAVLMLAYLVMFMLVVAASRVKARASGLLADGGALSFFIGPTNPLLASSPDPVTATTDAETAWPSSDLRVLDDQAGEAHGQRAEAHRASHER